MKGDRWKGGLQSGSQPYGEGDALGRRWMWVLDITGLTANLKM